MASLTNLVKNGSWRRLADSLFKLRSFSVDCEGEPVVVAFGRETTGIDAALVRGTIAGQLTNSAGSPISTLLFERLTLDEAAVLLLIDRQTIERWLDEGLARERRGDEIMLRREE